MSPSNSQLNNPLLESHTLPPFSNIKAEHIHPAIEALVNDNLSAVDALLKTQPSSWATLCEPLEELNDKLEQAWSPVSHLNAVVQTDALRDSYEKCLPLLSEYSTKLGQNRELFEAYQRLADSPEFSELSVAQRQAVTNQLRDFHLAGIGLEPAQQQRYAELKQALSEASNTFSNNVLDATQAWSLHVQDASELAGLPDTALKAAASAAEAKSLEGYLLTLDAPCYIAVVSYCDNRALREQMYRAYSSRASDQGPNAGEFDNSELMANISGKRHELAQLLGFKNYAEYSLATKMADDCQQVLSFLNDLSAATRPFAESEVKELETFSTAHGEQNLQAWDMSYYSEKLRKQKYDVDQEELRPYFPLGRVQQGLFDVAERLFNIEIKEDTLDNWHSDVSSYAISRNGELIARFYFDLYARESKRGGAWMADCRVRRRLPSGELQLPVAFLTCNFMAPAGNQPSLLSFNEATTLFHEFGHGLHHMLTKVEVADVSGINGVAWDAVELPSQFLENWCWEAEVINSMSAHFETGAPLPKEMLDKLLAAKNFQAGMHMLRQIEFALFDFELHMQSGMESANSIQNLLNDVRAKVAVVQPPAENRFQHGFSHIFAGGYAAGYYSYKWAEVLSADAFSKFEANGVFDPKTSTQFREAILERGGSSDAMTLFKEFMGRAPSVDALLRQSGLTA